MKLTKEALESAIEYFNTLEIPEYDGIADLLYYRPHDLERLGLTVEDVKKMLKT